MVPPVFPGEAVTLNVALSPAHTSSFAGSEILAELLTLTVTCEVSLLHPPLPVTTYRKT